MCGFLSIYLNKNKFKNEINNIKNNFEDFSFRGPDNSNFEEHHINNKKLLIGHHRLSIIDLDIRSNQPMNSENNRYKLIYNGEIYNHLDIRKELENNYKIKIDYLELRNINNLKISDTKKNSRLFIAYYLNKVRLIDNL